MCERVCVCVVWCVCVCVCVCVSESVWVGGCVRVSEGWCVRVWCVSESVVYIQPCQKVRTL